MAMQNAIDFIVNLKYDRNMRKRMNGLSPEQIHPFLETNGYIFSVDQFEDAINYYKLRCPTEQDAFDMDEIKFWFRFITTVFVKQ
jgi:hypothetical protein